MLKKHKRWAMRCNGRSSRGSMSAGWLRSTINISWRSSGPSEQIPSSLLHHEDPTLSPGVCPHFPIGQAERPALWPYRIDNSMPPKHALPPIFVVGSGRSGTTWIGGTIASCKGCISVFEPMHPDNVSEHPRWGMHCGLPGPYLSVGNSYPRWGAFFDALLVGRISNHWTRQDWTKV